MLLNKVACCSNHSNYYVLFCIFCVFYTDQGQVYQVTDKPTNNMTNRPSKWQDGSRDNQPTKWQTDQASDKTDQGTTNQPCDRQTKQQCDKLTDQPCDKRTYHMTYNQLKSWPINKPNIKLLLTYLQNLRQSSVEHLSLFLAVLEYDSHRNVGYSNGLVSHSHHCVYISAGPSLEETGNQP